MKALSPAKASAAGSSEGRDGFAQAASSKAAHPAAAPKAGGKAAASKVAAPEKCLKGESRRNHELNTPRAKPAAKLHPPPPAPEPPEGWSAPADRALSGEPERLVLLAEQRAARAQVEPTDGETNPQSAAARLEWVRACKELGEPRSAMRASLEMAVALGGELPAPLYEELGNMMKAEGEGEKAVALWCSFRYSETPNFEENVLRLSAANLMIQLRMHADESQHTQLKALLVAIGKGFGGASYVEKHIDALETKGFVQLCKEIYCGITGLPEGEQRALFQSKGWAPAFSSIETVSKPLGRREKAPPRQRPGSRGRARALATNTQPTRHSTLCVTLCVKCHAERVRVVLERGHTETIPFKNDHTIDLVFQH